VTAALDQLISLLHPEARGEDRFHGAGQDLGFGTLYGGHVLGQGLAAASTTVAAGRRAHSLHAYFLRPGDASRGVDYQVERLVDGISFSARRVTARQVTARQTTKILATISFSFQSEEHGFEHQSPSPSAPPPDTLATELELLQRLADKIPAEQRDKLLAERPIDLRPIEPMDPLRPEPRVPVKAHWFRTAGALPDEPALHRVLLAYASDFRVVGTALYPHGHSFWEPEMQVASIDHALWFHRDFRFDAWLLHQIESPVAAGGRGLNRGLIYDAEGQLVASLVQEGLIRQRRTG